MRESTLLEHIYAANRRLAAKVIVPPGDDMGAVRVGRETVLAAVDQVVDGRHFRLQSTPLQLIGRKSVARSLSDVAAMAALPVATLAAATLPPNFGEQRANDLFDAMREIADAFDAPLMGGDIAIHGQVDHPLTLSTTVLAIPFGKRPITRAGARPGDGVYVTGPLGGSLQPDGLGRHLTFTPRISLAIELLKELDDRLHAMIDISDGLGRDASNIARMSGVRIILNAADIPCNPGCTWKHALADGEDYELLLCAAPPAPASVARTPLRRIGEVVNIDKSEEPLVLVRHGQTLLSADDLGWEHAA